MCSTLSYLGYFKLSQKLYTSAPSFDCEQALGKDGKKNSAGKASDKSETEEFGERADRDFTRTRRKPVRRLLSFVFSLCNSYDRVYNIRNVCLNL